MTDYCDKCFREKAAEPSDYVAGYCGRELLTTVDSPREECAAIAARAEEAFAARIAARPIAQGEATQDAHSDGAVNQNIECKSDIGRVVGLVDALIAISNQVNVMLPNPEIVFESEKAKWRPLVNAIRDLFYNSPFKKIVNFADNEAMLIIQRAAERIPPAPEPAKAEASASKELIELARDLHQAALPDPYDERDTSVGWLREKMHKVAKQMEVLAAPPPPSACVGTEGVQQVIASMHRAVPQYQEVGEHHAAEACTRFANDLTAALSAQGAK